MDAVQRWLTLVTLVSASLAALGYLGRKTWRGFLIVQRIHDLLEHEFTHNGGASLKDDVASIAVAVGSLQRTVSELTESKELAHEVLQIQLDSVVDALGIPQHHPQHRRERKHDLSSHQEGQGPGPQER